MRLGLVIYSFKEARGDAYALMDLAAASGLRGVEFPPEDSLPAATPKSAGERGHTPDSTAWGSSRTGARSRRRRSAAGSHRPPRSARRCSA